jgi:acetyl esterase/lipase
MIRYEMRNLFAAASLIPILITFPLSAQQNRPSPSTPSNQSMIPDTTTIQLWEGRAPGAVGDEDRDKPTLTIYMPRSTPASGATAVVVCPGGGYGALAMNHEGREVANYLNALGIAAFVLKYRLGPRYHHPIELGDAQRAVRTVRARATEWRIAPERVGIMGFSAGGHLASTISTHFDAGKPDASDPIDRMNCRPDFAVLGYPVVSMTAPWTHQGSKRNLLGENPPPELAQNLSGELQVTAQTPPTFIFHTNADTGVPAENSIYYFLALRKAGVPAEMHIFQKGPHGVGLGMDDFALGEWPRLMENWLRVNGFLK